jgi:hypothetical protein
VKIQVISDAGHSKYLPDTGNTKKKKKQKQKKKEKGRHVQGNVRDK